MGAIKVLGEQMANRIAAGEVVERPASVVKELIENSLDAGARRIEVEIAEGGRRLVKVTDDGCGMDAEDAALSVQRFATSKVSDLPDLETITTMGFRGEALPSIAAVSQTRITTRPHDAVEGTMLTIEGGDITDARALGCPPGTTVEVANLFFNTPARLKFLRSTTTERGHCSDWVARLAMARPDVAARFTHDGTVLFTSPGRGDLLAVLAEAYGSSVARQMLPLELHSGAIRITGYVSGARLTRATRKHQLFFVNSRFVRSMTLSHALSEAYGMLLPSGKQPMCALKIELPPELVDPNVHPTKIEIRFKNQGEVHNLTQQAVETALAEAGLRAPSLRGARGPAERPPTETAGRWAGPDAQARMRARRLRVNPFAERVDERQEGLEVHGESPAAAEGVPAASADAGLARGLADQATGGSAATTAAPGPGEALAEGVAEGLEGERMRALGQVAGSYIVCRAGEDLLLVDQHRAAERVIADELSGREASVSRQMLVLPLTLELTDAEQAAVEQWREPLAHMGFEMEPFGGSGYLVRSVPSMLVDRNPEQALRGLIEEMSEWDEAPADDLQERLIATVACHSAVKAGEHLSDGEVRELIAALEQSSAPGVCPHGDPIIVCVSRDQLDRQFKRSSSPAAADRR
jgi:DNA mismatch repair protein MutL